MKYSCYNCGRCYKIYRLGDGGMLFCCGMRCEIGTEIKTGDEAQNCYNYRPRLSEVDLPKQFKPLELLVQLKAELSSLKNMIEQIENFYKQPLDE